MPHKRIIFRERGQGQVLLLLHGYGGSVHHWEDVASSLSRRFRIVVPNLGHLYLSTDKLSFSSQVEVLGKFIEFNFPNQKVHLAGLSFGGALAWGVAHQYPQLVGKCTLINPIVTEPMKNFLPIELRLFFKLPLNITAIYLILSTPLGRTFLKKTALIFRDEKSPEGGFVIEQLKGRKLQFLAYMIHNFKAVLRGEDWNIWSKKIQGFCSPGKIRLIYSREDLLFSEGVYQVFATHIGCEDLIQLSGAGHLASKNCPELISKHILEFLETSLSA